jgi:hypothetical protein
MTLRRRIAHRVEFSARILDLAALAEANPDFPALPRGEMEFTVGSRAEADAIAAAWGATAKWRDGYYMAERDFGAFVLELHFAPPITGQDAA